MNEQVSSLTTLALQKFKRNFWGVLSLCFITCCGLLAVFAYVLAPDNSVNANHMQLTIHSQPPGFSVDMLRIPSENKETQSVLSRLFFGSRATETEIPIVSYKVVDSLLYYNEYLPDGVMGLEKVVPLSKWGADATSDVVEKWIDTRTFWLGTDKYGRDMLSRMLVGTRISFSIGFIAVFISLIIGITLGALAGYFGGRIDALIMWFINVTWSIPTLLLVIAMTLALGKGYWQVFIAVGLTMWVEVARVVRGQVLSVKETQYVTAAKALGYGHLRIVFKHILPNVMAPVIVIAAANFASAILVESGLSFLGIGAQPPTPSWGAMIKDHYSYIILGKAYLALVPGVAIMSLVMAFMLVGNGLRDALDVKN